MPGSEAPKIILSTVISCPGAQHGPLIGRLSQINYGDLQTAFYYQQF